jgi:hypothetical protein
MALFTGVVLLVTFLLWHDSRTELLTKPPTQRKSRLAFLGKFAGPVREQWLKVKSRLFGTPSVVMVLGTVFEMDPPATLPDWPASALTNRFDNCVFTVTNCEAWKQKVISMPQVHGVINQNVVASERAQGQLSVRDLVSVGTATNLRSEWEGWSLDVWPRAQAHSVNLVCFFTFAERARVEAGAGTRIFLRTNFAFGARAELPDGGGLVLWSGVTNSGGKVITALLTPVVYPPPRGGANLRR